MAEDVWRGADRTDCDSVGEGSVEAESAGNPGGDRIGRRAGSVSGGKSKSGMERAENRSLFRPGKGDGAGNFSFAGTVSGVF